MLANRQVGEEGSVAPRLHLHRVGAMIDKMANGNAMREFRRVPDVVSVKVRDHHVIEDAHIRRLQHRHDAVRVARDAWSVRLRGRHALIARKSRVHQHRLSRGRNEQRGLPAFRVQEINIQRLFLCRLLLRVTLSKTEQSRAMATRRRQPYYACEFPLGNMRW